LGAKTVGHLLQHLDLIFDPPEFLGPCLRHALIIIINIILVDDYLRLRLSLPCANGPTWNFGLG
jgi:hypothetical protein